VRGDIAHQQAGLQNDDPVLLAEARDEYQRSLELDGAQGGVAFALGSLLLRDEAKLAEARQVAEAAVNRLPLDRVPVNLFQLLLDLYLRTGQLRQADGLLGKALMMRPMQEDWLVAKAELGYRTGRCQETLAELAALLSRAGPTAPLAYARARLYELLEQRQAALAAAEQARQLLPTHVPSRLLLARQYLALKQYDLALEHVGAALRREPSAWDAHVLRAEIHQGAGRADECRKAVEDSQRLLSDSLTQEPARPELYRTAARLHQLAGAPDAALEVLERGRRKLPGSAALLAQQVEIHLAQGHTEQAKRLADETAPAEPSAELCFLLGRAFQSHGDLTAAELWARRGCERAGPGRLLAARLLLAAVALDRGKKAGDRKSFELAREQYAAILADCPRHVIAGNNLAWLLVNDLDSPDAALTVAQQVRGPAGPEALHPDFLATLLRVYRQTRRWAEGQSLLEAALPVAPNNPSLQLEIGLFHAATNSPAAAREALQRALRAGLDGEQKREAEHWISTLAAG
jgi:tetratricopeptide (TPR) repeat protein